MSRRLLKFSVLICLCGGVSVTLSACDPAINFKLATIGISAASNGFFKRTDVNLREKNNAAADYMSVPMKEFVGRTDLIRLQPLTQSDNEAITSPLGMKIAEDIALRFIHLGFKVDMHNVASDAVRDMVSPASEQAKFIFSGHYLRGNKNVDISLRVSNAQTGQVVSVFDFRIPVTREIESLSNTLPRIFKVEPSY